MDIHNSTSRPHVAPYPEPRVAWYATFLLAGLYWLAILDRFIISLLVDPIKEDLQITDVQFSLLHGVAFSLTFSIFGLIAGSLADRLNRRWIICTSVAIWSLATTACGMAHSFWQLLLARVGVGCGESGLNPSATSMITDLFPKEKLTSALAVYTIGATLGSGMAYIFGGVIVDFVSTLDSLRVPVVGELRTWQAVFFIIGIPGILLSFAIFTIPEPVRRGRTSHHQPTGAYWANIFLAYRNLFQFMKSHGRFFVCHYVGFSLTMVVLSGAALWYPAHMSRAFSWSASEIGLGLGFALMVGGISGKLITGYAVDTMFQRGSKDAQLRWFMGCLLVGAPIGVLATSSDNVWVFLFGVSVFTTLLAPMPPCSNAALNIVTPNELRGTGIALFAATSGIIGSTLGPIIIASIAEYAYSGPSAMGMALATVIGICCPAAALVMYLGLNAMRNAVEAAESF